MGIQASMLRTRKLKTVAGRSTYFVPLLLSLSSHLSWFSRRNLRPLGATESLMLTCSDEGLSSLMVKAELSIFEPHLSTLTPFSTSSGGWS